MTPKSLAPVIHISPRGIPMVVRDRRILPLVAVMSGKATTADVASSVDPSNVT
jgi:hypothetical protein